MYYIKAAFFPAFLALVLLHADAVAGPLDDFLFEDQSPYCGVERYEDILETACGWDAAARASGNCDAPKYQEAVGKRPIYRACRSLLALSAGGPLQATAPAEAPDGVKRIWRLVKAVQPLAVQATSVSEPACFTGIKPYAQRNQKADHVFYFNCLDERDSLVLKKSTESNEGKIVRAIGMGLLKAKIQDADSELALGELTLLIEDEGAKAKLKVVDELLSRIK